MVTPERARELALALEGASEAPHFDRTAFRVPRRIFATLGRATRDVNLMLDGELQAAVVEARPRAFAPVKGGWGRMGWTRCDLDAVAEVDLVRALREAHAIASAPPPKRAKTKRASAKAPARKTTKKTARR